MKAFYKENKVIVVASGKEYPFCLAASVTAKRAIQLMTKMHVNGTDFYAHENGTADYSKWQSVELK